MPMFIGHLSRVFIDGVEVPVLGVLGERLISTRLRRLKRLSKKFRRKKGRRKQ
jgi:hypothetical protein